MFLKYGNLLRETLVQPLGQVRTTAFVEGGGI